MNSFWFVIVKSIRIVLENTRFLMIFFRQKGNGSFSLPCIIQDGTDFICQGDGAERFVDKNNAGF
jgi:hypothetical protein